MMFRAGERVLVTDEAPATGCWVRWWTAWEAEVAGMTFFIELGGLNCCSLLATRRLHSASSALIRLPATMPGYLVTVSGITGIRA